MNIIEQETVKLRGSADACYLGETVDQMVWDFMKEKKIPGLALAIVQAPYIPRMVGYGLSDTKQKRLASTNTMWPIGPVSQGFTAVAIMQLQEDGKLDVSHQIADYIPGLPQTWQTITILQLLRHASGLADYRCAEEWDPCKDWRFEELVQLISKEGFHFASGFDVELCATNFLLLAEVVEQVSGISYQEFVTQRQIGFLGLRHTGFADSLDKFPHEDLSLTENVHQLFKKDGQYMDPVEPAASYDESGSLIPSAHASALKGFSDIWASAQDISLWDISLADDVLIRKPEHRAMLSAPWKLPDEREIPAVAGRLFYKHGDLMEVKGSVAGYSSFLSRFTHPEESVGVTLLANKEGVDFTNLGRRIASALNDLLSTNYNDNRLFLQEGQLSVADTVAKLERELERRSIPLFAKIDHAENARNAGLTLRPTTVLIFGSPLLGTGLMKGDQSISVELPLRISIWEDEAGITWLAFRRTTRMAADYGLEGHLTMRKMDRLMGELVTKAAGVY